MNIPYLLFKKVTNNFSEDRIIGEGGFGKVYKGELDDGELIAVKMLHPLQGLNDEQFKNEVCNNLFKDGHPNITWLLGYCDEIHSEFVEHKGEKFSSKHVYRGLCFEYFPSGSLHNHLVEQTLTPTWSTRYNIIKGICEGLNFLHGCKPPIFHLDLKPDNILLDSSMVPKLADFGLSRLFADSRTHITQRTIGTDKYMPPEYRIAGTISSQNDVFSFGIVMIEIMEGYSLFQEMEDITQFKQEVFAKWSSNIDTTSNYRKNKLIQVQTCIDIAMRCVDSGRKDRPTAASILATLNGTETHIPSTQLTVEPLSPTINIKNSLAEMLKKMIAELDNITNSMANMEQVPDRRRVSSNVGEPLVIERTEDRETSSYIKEGFIIGRTKEKNKILCILSESSMNEMVILPIYGFGGTGKTTLAQLVYNDTQFSGYSRVWVYVSEQLDLHKIGNSIISQLSKEITTKVTLQIINDRIAEVFADKRILIVLDDLWEDQPRELDKLKAMLMHGMGKKVIIVTTRDEAIARKLCITVKNVPYKLELLTDDKCWAIIKQKSDFENQADKNFLEQIGRDIAIKCGGVALAAQSLGYMLRYMTSDQWELVRDSDIWNLSTSEDPSLTTHEVLASLWLSYSNMHKFLKLSFSYCAVFPKGYLIAKYDLIHQWIALEFKPSGIFDSMQLCEQYFRQLLGMSFLQYATSPSERPDEYTTLFTMHDLVHDLATATLADKVNKNSNNVGSSCEYALVRDRSKPLQSSVSSPQNLKALHFVDYGNRMFIDGAISPAKCLHVLDLSGFIDIEKLPDSIGQLKQLRYLHAPRIRDQMTPNFICELSELNYLSIRGSRHIKAFPNAIGDVKGLMHLDLSGCEQLRELPVSFAGLRQLVHLNLSNCQVHISESWGGFTKLQYLNLSRHHYYVCDVKVLVEVIRNLTKLQYLNLKRNMLSEEFEVLPKVLGKLTKLRYLNLAECMQRMSHAGIHDFLVGISTLYNLEHLDLYCLERLKSIPESIGNLTKLHTLDLSRCKIQKFPEWMAKMVSLKIVNLTTLDDCSSNIIMFAASNPTRLRISKLEDVKSVEDAQSIKLMEKRRINDLRLEWTVGSHTSFVDEKDVMEKLVPPYTVEMLTIHGYSGLGFPTNWLIGIGQYLPNVSMITLSYFPKCNNLPPLGQLPNLWSLIIHHLDSLVDLYAADSCGELMFPKLCSLHIQSCPKLTLKPFLPRTLSHLSIDASDDVLTSWGECVSETIGSSSSSSLLTCLEVARSKAPLLQWTLLQHVSVTNLFIRDCRDLTCCSPEVTQRLSSLESLKLEDDNLTELPTWLLELTRLESLILHGCRNMASLPQWLGELTSLERLQITECKEIRYLPGSIRQLTKLKNVQFNRDFMSGTDIEKLFLSISADAAEVNIQKFRAGDPFFVRRVGVVRHTWTRRPNLDAAGRAGPALVEAPGWAKQMPTRTTKTSSGSKVNNSALDQVDVEALVSSSSAISIDSGFAFSATKQLSDPPANAGAQQLVPAASTVTPNSLYASSEPSMINNNGTADDALIILADVVATAAATDIEDLVRSFSALSLEPGS